MLNYKMDSHGGITHHSGGERQAYSTQETWLCRLLICVTTDTFASGLFALNVILSFSKLPTFIMWKGYPFVNEG